MVMSKVEDFGWDSVPWNFQLVKPLNDFFKLLLPSQTFNKTSNGKISIQNVTTNVPFIAFIKMVERVT